jgi:hypothetical protein
MKKNISEELPCCCASDPGKAATKLTLPDGFQVGVIHIDNVLKEVAAMKLAEASTIKTELMKRFAKENYVPSCAADEYSAALFREYKQKFFEAV